MGEHGVRWENIENIASMENMEMMKHQTDDLKHSIQNSKDYVMTQITIFVNKTKHYFTAFMVTVEKVIKQALGEHDSGSAQDGTTSSKMQSPANGRLSPLACHTYSESYLGPILLANCTHISTTTETVLLVEKNVQILWFSGKEIMIFSSLVLFHYFSTCNIFGNTCIFHNSMVVFVSVFVSVCDFVFVIVCVPFFLP